MTTCSPAHSSAKPRSSAARASALRYSGVANGLTVTKNRPMRIAAAPLRVLATVPASGTLGCEASGAPSSRGAQMAELKIANIDDVPWQEVKAQQHGDRRVSIWEKYLEWTPGLMVLYARYDPG